MKDDKIYLKHIIDALEKIGRYLKEVSEESFYGDDMLLDATIRELEIIGEATNNISEDFQLFI